MNIVTNQQRIKKNQQHQLPLVSEISMDGTKENLRAIFKDIRNYLAGRATGMTRDESLLIELVKILFCKFFSEKHHDKSKNLFVAKESETPKEVLSKITKLFDLVCNRFPEVFFEFDQIKLDSESVKYIVNRLQDISLLESSRDPVGDAFEIFINSTLRGAEGQFFTPRNAIDLLVGICAPKQDDKILDPACGSGSFLVSALKYLESSSEKKKKPHPALYGIDKDRFLSFIASAHITLLLDSHANIECNNSLLRYGAYSETTASWFKENTFDLILTNPPYGADIKIGDDDLKSQYQLAFKWSNSKDDGYKRTSTLQPNPSPQIIFLERCLSLLKPGGRCGIVIPESVFCNPSYGYVTNFLLNNSKIIAVVSFPESLFKTSGKTGTHTKTVGVVFEKLGVSEKINSSHKIFFAETKWCGHDSRGLTIPHDDFPKVLENFKKVQSQKNKNGKRDILGFEVPVSDIKNGILLPKFYDPELDADIANLGATHDLIRFGDLVKSNVIEIKTGDEVGKLAYGTGDIPFVRTSDISNWEIKIDPKQGVSEEVFKRLKKRQDIVPGDILMVRDGTYLVGTTALVTEHDLPLVYQSHIYKIRSLNHDLIDPYLLLAIMSSPIAQRQIQAFRFTQDIIDTLGNRINDIVLPIPKSKKLKNKVINDVREAINARSLAREAARKARLEVVGLA